MASPLEKAGNVMTYQDQAYKQAKAIRKYATILGVDVDTAFKLWVENRLAKRWREQNKR